VTTTNLYTIFAITHFCLDLIFFFQLTTCFMGLMVVLAQLMIPHCQM